MLGYITHDNCVSEGSCLNHVLDMSDMHQSV